MIRLLPLLAVILPFSLGSYCGKYGVPYSFEVLGSGAPVLGCAQPSCVIQPDDFEEDSEFLTDAKGQVDGYFREGDRETKRFRNDKAPRFVANCSGGFENLACSKKDQWVGGIEYIDHPRQPLVLQCCSYEGLKFSQEVGMTTIGPGEAITGGEVVRSGRQISFDVIANVKKIVNSGKINYEVTVRRMNCLPDPPEPEIPFDDDVPAEIAKVLGTAKNGKDLGTAEKFEKKHKPTDKVKKGKKHRKGHKKDEAATQAPPTTPPPTLVAEITTPQPTAAPNTEAPKPVTRQLPNPPAQPDPQVQVQPAPQQIQQPQPQVPYNTQQGGLSQVPVQPAAPEVPPPQPQPIQGSGSQVAQGVPNSQQGPSNFGCQEGAIQQAVFQQPNQPCYGVANQQFGPTPPPPVGGPSTPATILLTFPTHTFPPHTFPAHTFPPGGFPTLPPHTFPPGGFPTLPPHTFPPGIPTLPPHTFPPGGAFPTLPPHTFGTGPYIISPVTFPPGPLTLPPHTFPPGGFPTLPPHTFPPGGFPTLPPHTFPPYAGFPGFPAPASAIGGASAFGAPSVSGASLAGTGGSASVVAPSASFGAPSVSGAAALGAPSVGVSAPIAPIPPVSGGLSGGLPTLPTLATFAPLAVTSAPLPAPAPRPLPVAAPSGSQAQAQASNPGAPVNMELPPLNPTPELSALEAQLKQQQGGIAPAQTAGGINPPVHSAPTFQSNPNECSDATTTTSSSDCNNNQVQVQPITNPSGALPTAEELKSQQQVQYPQQYAQQPQQQAYPQQVAQQQQVPYYTNNGKK